MIKNNYFTFLTCTQKFNRSFGIETPFKDFLFMNYLQIRFDKANSLNTYLKCKWSNSSKVLNIH